MSPFFSYTNLLRKHFFDYVTYYSIIIPKFFFDTKNWIRMNFTGFDRIYRVFEVTILFPKNCLKKRSFEEWWILETTKKMTILVNFFLILNIKNKCCSLPFLVLYFYSLCCFLYKKSILWHHQNWFNTEIVIVLTDSKNNWKLRD